jgi:hypothetical protein
LVVVKETHLEVNLADLVDESVVGKTKAFYVMIRSRRSTFELTRVRSGMDEMSSIGPAEQPMNMYVRKNNGQDGEPTMFGIFVSVHRTLCKNVCLEMLCY